MTILPKKKANSNKELLRSNVCSSSSQCHVGAAPSGASVVSTGGSAAATDHLASGDSLSAVPLTSSMSGAVIGHRRHFNDKSASSCGGLVTMVGASDSDATASVMGVAALGASGASASSLTSSHRSKRCKTRATCGPAVALVDRSVSSSSAVPLSSPTNVAVGGGEKDGGGMTDNYGYNSEDEYEKKNKNADYSDEMERKFEEKIEKSKGYNIKKMKEDGACLFRAVADQVYGDQEMHGVVRKLCMDYMAKNADHFSPFVTEDFGSYVARKRLETSHGNHAEIQALAEIFNRPIEVYQYSLEPINIFYTNSSAKCDVSVAPIRVTYHHGLHYNSLVDPYAATIGIGLGLPQYHPGSADKNLVKDAERASEQDEIEQAMLKDKLKATDWEATDEQIQEQIARESYLEWIRSQEKKMKENVNMNRGESTVTRSHKPKSPPYQHTRSSKSDQAGCESAHSDTCTEKAGPSHRSANQQSGVPNPKLLEDLSPSLYGISQFEDDNDMINQMLALSQQEYYDGLKKLQREGSS